MTTQTDKSKQLIEAAQAHIIENLTPAETLDAYRDHLNEIYEDCLTGPFSHMSPAKLLEEDDETAFRCGHNDWLDSECTDGRYVYIGNDYFDPCDVRDSLEDWIDTQREPLAALAAQITELEERRAECVSEDEAEAIEENIDTLQAQYDELDTALDDVESNFDL